MGFILLAQIVSWVCNILILAMLARSVLSWIVYSGNQYNSSLGKVYDVLSRITEPIVAPVRRLISRFINTGPMDFAPLVTFFIIMLVRRLLTSILIGLA